MAKCESCGKELSADARFCSYCGAAVITTKEEFTVSSDNLVGEVKKIFNEGSVRKIIVKDEKGNTLLEIPAWAGVVGAIVAPWLAALGAIATIATKCSITVVRRESP